MKKFDELKVNDIVINKASGVKYKLTRKINDSVWEMVNQRFRGIIDYLNKNTFDEYEVEK